MEGEEIVDAEEHGFRLHIVPLKRKTGIHNRN